MKAVLDTNVIVSGLLWKGIPAKILDLVQNKKFSFCLTPKLLEEIGRVLTYPKLSIPLTLKGQQPEKIIEALEQESLLLPDIQMPPVVKEDPTDDIILGAALVHQADFIVSGDKHLLKLKKFQNIPIITSAVLIKQF